MEPSDAEHPPWLVRIFDARGPVGAGCLLDDRFVATCAHVVSAAMGGHERTGTVSLDFPFISAGRRLQAETMVDAWNLPKEGDLQDYEPAGRQDVAVLKLVDALPSGARPPIFVEPMQVWQHSFRAFGFPANHDDGVWVRGSVLGGAGSGWLQLQAYSEAGYPVSKGFSGSPIWDDRVNGVIGIMVAAERDHSTRASFCIPLKTIARFWPPLGADLRRSQPVHPDESGLFLIGLTVNGRQHNADWDTASLVDVWLRGEGDGAIVLSDIEVEHSGGDGYGGGTGALPIEAEYSFPFEFHRRRRHVLEPPLIIYPDDREFVRFRLGVYPSGSFPVFGGTVSATLFYSIERGEIGRLPLMRAPAGWKLLARATALPIPLRIPGGVGVCEVTPEGAIRGTAPNHSWDSIPMVADFDERWLARPEYLPLLTNAVSDADMDVRILAIRALGELGKNDPQLSDLFTFNVRGTLEDALDALSYALGDEEKSVRAAAVAALMAIDPRLGSDRVATGMGVGVAPLLQIPYMKAVMSGE